MPFKKKHIAVVVLFLLAFSCTVKKRMYRDGYYISWNKDRGARTDRHKKQNSSISELSSKEEIILEASSKNRLIIPVNTIEKELPDSNACGDTLFLRSGTKYIVKIIELTEKNIKIRRCSDKAGNIISFALEDVDRAVDINGNLVTKQDKEKDKKKAIEKRKTELTELKKDKTYRDKNMFASFALIVLLLSLFVIGSQMALNVSLLVSLPIFAVFVVLAFKFKGMKLSFIRVMMHKQDPNVSKERSRIGALFFMIGIVLIASLLLFYDTAILFQLLGLFFVFQILALLFSLRSLRSPDREQGKELASTILVLSILASIAGLIGLFLLNT